MQTTTSDYDRIIGGNHYKEVKLNIAGTDYGMDILAVMKSSRQLFGSESKMAGLAISKTLSVGMIAPDETIPRMAELQPFVRVVNADDPDDYSEWIPKGVYYIDTRKLGQGNYLEIEAFDSMMKAEAFPEFTFTSWPRTDTQVVNAIATAIGVQVDSRTMTLMNKSFSIPSPEEYTMREILENIAALYGGSFLINDQNKLQLVCLWDRPPETYYLVDPDGSYILFGSQSNPSRIILKGRD